MTPANSITADMSATLVASPAMSTHVGPTPPHYSLPHSAVMAWWLTAWLRGHEQTDTVLDVLGDDGAPPPGRIAGRPARRRAPVAGVVRRAGAAGRGRPARARRPGHLQRRGAGRRPGGRRRRAGPGAGGGRRDRAVARPPGRSAPAARRGRGRPGAAGDPGGHGRRPGRPRGGALAARGSRCPDEPAPPAHARRAAGHTRRVRRPRRPGHAGLVHRGPGPGGRRRRADVVRRGAAPWPPPAARARSAAGRRRRLLTRGLARSADFALVATPPAASLDTPWKKRRRPCLSR